MLSVLLKIRSIFSVKSRKTKFDHRNSNEGFTELEVGVDWTLLLPEPVLKRIFEYYTFGNLIFLHSSGDTVYLEADPLSGPLLLTQICERWRRFTISLPHLWSSLCIGSSHHPDLLQQWLQRSGTQPLSLHIDCLSKYTTKTVTTEDQQTDPHLYHARINTALGLISKEMGRWKKLNLTLDFESASAFIQTNLADASNLEEISIRFVGRHSASMPPRILAYLDTSLDKLSSLKQLSWESTLPREQMISPLRRHDILDKSHLWGRLNRVELKTGITMNEAAMFLRMCMNASLVALECIVNDDMDDLDPELRLYVIDWPQDKTFTMHKLEELSIGFGGAFCDCTMILQNFNFPSLHTLRINNFQTNHKSCSLLEDVLNRSRNVLTDATSQMLRCLLIRDDYMSEETILRLICMPLLQHVPIVNLYTHRPVEWAFLSETLHHINISTVHYLDLQHGRWVGWGGFPISSQY